MANRVGLYREVAVLPKIDCNVLVLRTVCMYVSAIYGHADWPFRERCLPFTYCTLTTICGFHCTRKVNLETCPRGEHGQPVNTASSVSSLTLHRATCTLMYSSICIHPWPLFACFVCELYISCMRMNCWVCNNTTSCT